MAKTHITSKDNLYGMAYCEIAVLVSFILLTQWFCILYFLRLKFKTRYALASIVTFLLMGIYTHIGLNCLYTPSQGQREYYIPAVKHEGLKIRNVRELQQEVLEQDEGQAQAELDNIYNDGHDYEEHAKEAEEFPMFNPSIKAEGRHKMLNVDEKVKEMPLLKDDKNVMKQSNDADEDESDLFQQKIDKNLENNIYNNKSWASVMTFNDYGKIAELINFKTKKQQQTSTALNLVEGGKAWENAQNKIPFKPTEALNLFGKYLPWWEQIEIKFYPNIYYLGLGANKTIFVNNITENFGFDQPPTDEDEPMYIPHVGGHIAYRYEIRKILGSGTYGVVVNAFDHATKRTVGIKFLRNREDWGDKEIRKEFTMMLKVASEAKRNNYFPAIHDHFMFRNHKCVVMELLGGTMHRENRGYKPMTNMTLLRRYAYDILNAVVELDKMHIIHADLKPANMMFMPGKNNESEGQLLKVADFGLGCIRGDKDLECTSSVQTRNYRCPEVMLKLPYYHVCDVYSVGIILGEFFLGQPPISGESDTDQLAATMEVLGVFPPHMVKESPRIKTYQEATCYVKKNGFKRRPYRKSLEIIFKGMPHKLFDLIKKCLTLDPDVRITAAQALKHPFIADD